MFNCDNGTYDAWYWAHPPVYMPDNCNFEDVAHIKNFTDKPVVCAGKMDIKFAAEKIKEGKIDALGIARQNLVDPDWVTKLREGREEEIKPCIRCHNACFNFAKSKHTANTQPLFDSLQLARCALTPSTMQHNKYKIVPTNKPKKVAIVGAGFGGLEAALVLKKRGHNPVVFEKSDKIFGLYNTATSTPSSRHTMTLSYQSVHSLRLSTSRDSTRRSHSRISLSDLRRTTTRRSSSSAADFHPAKLHMTQYSPARSL